MKNFKFDTLGRTVKVLTLDGKHIKSIPKKYMPHIHKVPLDLKRKSLNRFEKLHLECCVFVEKLKGKDRVLSISLSSEKPVSRRIVYPRGQENERYEIKFTNGFYVKVPHRIFMLCDEEEESVKLNY